MSPRWHDELAISLAPRRIALVRRSRGLRPRIVASTELAVPEGAFGDIRPALASLADVLADPRWHGAAARVAVGHPWTCFGIVPWPKTRLDAAGRLAHARYVLGDVYGEGVADWTVTLAETPPSRPIVACAMPATLRGALEEVFAPARVRLVSLKPRLAVAFNAWRRRLPSRGAWFVTVDDASLSAVHLSRGTWDRVYTARLSADWRLELERLQSFAAVILPGGSGRMWVDAPARMRRAAGALEGVEWLSEGDGAQGQELALLRRVPA